MQIETGHLDIIERNHWDAFRQAYPGDEHFRLACYASLPVALTSDLLYKIWLNFRVADPNADPLETLATVSDLLHSPICREIGRDIYEIHPNIKKAMLEALQNGGIAGKEVVFELARFLRDYVRHSPEKLPSATFREAQIWIATSYLEPENAAKKIIELLTQEASNEKTAGSVDYLLRLAKQRNDMLRSPSGKGQKNDALLAAEQFVNGFRQYRAGDLKGAIEQFRNLDSIIEAGQPKEKGFSASIPMEVWEALRPTATKRRQGNASDQALELIEREKRERTGYLDLGNCGLTEWPDLSEMDWLHTLIMSSKWWDWERHRWENSSNNGTPNQLNAPPSFLLPHSIKHLIARGNPWDNGEQNFDISFVLSLPELVSLDLSFNKITNAFLLTSLNGLTTLSFSFSQISDFSFLHGLSELTSLDISGNQIADANFLNGFAKLQSLNIGFNKITDASFLSFFSELKNLNISFNKIADASFFIRLHRLESLDISFNQVAEFSLLELLTALTSLDISGNFITDIRFINTLSRLKLFNVSFNQITDTLPFKNLTSLESLDISGTQIVDFSFLKAFHKLTTLGISLNQIKDTRFLEPLTKLTFLDVSGNQITDASFLKKLNYLTSLDISDNQIKDLSPLLHLIEKGIPVVLDIPLANAINAQGNPLDNPPLEVVRQGNATILAYFQQKQNSNSETLNEAKLIIIGDAGSGKTSLANRLLDRELPMGADRTQGIDIMVGEYSFPIERGKDFKLNIWDLGGQDKYKLLNQFFFTEGAIYVLVAQSNRQTDLSYWLQTVELFGNGSPLVILFNDYFDGEDLGGFDQAAWQKRFPNLLKGVHWVNLATRRGFLGFEQELQQLAQMLPHTRYEFPSNWTAIRRGLDNRIGRNYISMAEYLDICEANNLKEEKSAMVLISVLHKVGSCLHYQDNPLLEQYIILNINWLTKAAYRILDDPNLGKEQRGILTQADFERIWSDKEYGNMRPQLLELMRQFKIVYPLPNNNGHIVPSLLLNAPPRQWQWEEDNDIELRLEYEFLPNDIMSQFIVMRYLDIDEGRKLVWRKGVVLRWEGAVAIVGKTQSHGMDAIIIKCQGGMRKVLMTSILKTFRDLHGQYKNIKVSEKLPCFCHGCKSKENEQFFFKFERLKRRFEKGGLIIGCENSTQDVSIVELVSQVLVLKKIEAAKGLEIDFNPTQNDEVDSKQHPLQGPIDEVIPQPSGLDLLPTNNMLIVLPLGGDLGSGHYLIVPPEEVSSVKSVMTYVKPKVSVNMKSGILGQAEQKVAVHFRGGVDAFTPQSILRDTPLLRLLEVEREACRKVMDKIDKEAEGKIKFNVQKIKQMITTASRNLLAGVDEGLSFEKIKTFLKDIDLQEEFKDWFSGITDYLGEMTESENANVDTAEEKFNFRKELRTRLNAYMETLEATDIKNRGQLRTFFETKALYNDELIRSNISAILAASRDIERSYRELEVFFKNAGPRRVRNVTLLSYSVSAFQGGDFDRLSQAVRDTLMDKGMRLDLSRSYSSIVFPRMLGGDSKNTSSSAYSDFQRLLVLTDIPIIVSNIKDIEPYIQRWVSSNAHSKNLLLFANNIVLRKPIVEYVEKLELLGSSAMAVAGLLYSSSIFKFNENSLRGVKELSFKVSKPEAKSYSEKGINVLGYVESKIMPLEFCTAFIGHDTGLKNPFLSLTMNYITKILEHHLNVNVFAFQKIDSKMLDDSERRIEAFLKLLQEQAILEQGKIEEFGNDSKRADSLRLSINIKLPNNAKSFVLKMDISRGFASESIS